MTAELKKTASVGGKKTVIAAVAILAMTVGLAGCGSAESLDTVKADCAAASDALRLAQNGYSGLVNGDAAAASEYTADDVTDAATIDALAAALGETEPELAACNVDTADELKAQTEKIKSNTTWYEEHTASLDDAVKAVNDSLK